MAKRDASKEPLEFEHEIGYSQGVIRLDVLLGLALLLGGIALAYWTNTWAALCMPLGGLYMIWKAENRALQPAPQVKIGASGIWTIKAGFQPWKKTQAVVETKIGFRHSVSIYLVLLNRVYPNRSGELDRITIRELDVDAPTLKAYLDKYSPKQL